MSTMGERIKEIRKQNGLNQKKFAEELGISQNHVSNIENGNENPSAPLLKLLCFKFNVDEHWLRNGGGSGAMPSFDVISDEGLMAKYNTMRVILETMLRKRTGEELKYTVEAFSYMVALLGANGVLPENREAYLETAFNCISGIEQQEYASHGLGRYGKLGENSYKMQLRYRDETEARIAFIEQEIRKMNNIHLEQLQAATKL